MAHKARSPTGLTMGQWRMANKGKTEAGVMNWQRSAYFNLKNFDLKKK
jgi:hypothetical protein